MSMWFHRHLVGSQRWFPVVKGQVLEALTKHCRLARFLMCTRIEMAWSHQLFSLAREFHHHLSVQDGLVKGDHLHVLQLLIFPNSKVKFQLVYACTQLCLSKPSS
jgi:hypothetical protein